MLNLNALTICTLPIEKERNILRRRSHELPDKRIENRQKTDTETSTKVHILGSDPIRVHHKATKGQTNDP